MLFVRIKVTLFIFSALILTASLLISRQQPEVVASRDIYRCGDRICVWTLIPLQTSYTEAEAMILADPQFKFPNSAHVQADKLVEPYYTILLHVDYEANKLTGASLYFPPYGTLTARALVAKFGTPCALRRFVYPGYLAIYYPDMDIYLEDDSSAERIHLNSALLVKQIDIKATGIHSCAELTSDVPLTPWHGFGLY